MFEYVYGRLDLIPNPWFFNIRNLFQYSGFQDSMVLLGNLMVLQFYHLVFKKERSTEIKWQYGIYLTWTVLSIGAIVWIFQTTSPFPVFSAIEKLLTRIEYFREINVILHSFVVIMPLIYHSLALRKKILLQDKDDPAGPKFLSIFAMGLSFLATYVLAILDSLVEINIEMLYIIIVFIVLAAFFAYLGLIKELDS